MKKLGPLRLAICLGVAVSTFPAGSQERRITIATGSEVGNYYAAGKSVCRLIDAGAAEHGIRCTAQVTPGSVFNLNEIRSGDVDIAIVQSDWQRHAVAGTSVFEDFGPNPELRALVSLFPESMTVVTHNDSGIELFGDLKGKRVILGQPGSGSRRTAEAVMGALGWQETDFTAVGDLKLSEASGPFCNRRYDAVVLTMAHPHAALKDVMDRCQGVLIAASNDSIQQLIAENVEYIETEIPGEYYGTPDSDLPSIGVMATVVATQALDDMVAFELVKAIASNADALARENPVFRDLGLGAMRDGHTAPLHPGAERYFQEVGAQ